MSDEPIRDLDPSTRTYLNRICFDDLKSKPFTQVVEESGLPGQFYSQAQKQIYGDRNMTPGVLLRICKITGDYNPIIMEAEKLGIRITIEAPHDHSDSITQETLEAIGSVGEASSAINEVLKKKSATKSDLMTALQKVDGAITELRDVGGVIGSRLRR